MSAISPQPLPRRRRVLFVAEAVSLAHVARPVQLAMGLDPQRYECHLAWHPRYTPLFGPIPFTQHAIESITPQQFLDALAKGRPLYDVNTLREYVWQEMALLDKVQPDAVVGDLRLSLSVSTRLQGVPYLNITNAYWSPYAQQRYPIPEHALVRLLGVKWAQRLFDVCRPVTFAQHALAMRALRIEHGLPSLGLDLRHVYTDGDWTLYADVPELAPLHGAPSNHVYVGPIPWSPAVPLPTWWDALPQSRPIVYVTPGSTGHGRILGTVLEALGPLAVTVIAASAGQEISGITVPENARVEPFLPGLEAAARAALTICNGGSPTTYQALAAGKPVLGLATNMDQLLNMQGIERAGAGLCLRAAQATAQQIQAATSRLLAEPGFTTAAGQIGRSCQRYRSSAVLASVLERALTAPPHLPLATQEASHELSV